MIPLTEAQKKVCQNPVKAIRQRCLDCSGWSRQEVELCPLTECALYPFRLGKNPFRTRRESKPLTDEQREILRQRIKKATEIRMASRQEMLSENFESEDES